MGIVLAERKRNKSKSKPRTRRAKAPTAKQLAARRRFSRIMKNGGFSKKRRITRKKNVAAGFYDEDGIFHPIRASYDYDNKRTGEATRGKGYARKGSTKKRRRNVAAGFYDEDGVFHPIRASYDYSAKRAGESSRGRGYARKGAKKKTRRNPPNPRYRKSTLGSGKSTWTPEYRKRVAKASAQVRRQMQAEGKLRSTKAPVKRGGVFSRLFSRFANPSALQQHQALMKEWLRYEKAWRAGRLDAKGRVKQMQIERRLRQLEATIARQNPGKKINAPGFGPKFKRAVVVIKKAQRVVVKNASRRKAVTRKRRNPKRPYNAFRGRPAEHFYNVKTSDRTPSTGLKEAGKLHAVKLGGGRATYKFRGKAKLMYKGNNLYFGGWKFKRPNPPAEVDLGPVTIIEYLADKPHIEGDNLKRIYFHKMGEDGGYPPHLVVDAEGYPFLDGGSYGITPEGIVH